MKFVYFLPHKITSGLVAGVLVWLTLFFAPIGAYASITWGLPASISGDTDVITSGLLAYAYTGGSGGATVNGVAFAAGNSGTAWGGSVSLSSFGSTYSAYSGGTSTPWSNLSSAYKTVLEGGAYGSATTGIVSLNGLTIGHAYTVEIWVNDARSAGSGRSETATGANAVSLDYNDLNAVGGVGQYVVGTFVASSTSQSFTLSSSSSDQLNALQVRDNGYVAAQAAVVPTRVNLAKDQPVITDSTNGTQTAGYITDGFVDDDSCWVSGSTGPHWAQVVFPFPVTVGSAQLAMGQKNASPLTVFYFQYLTNGTWMTVPGLTVAGNTNVERNIVFSAPVTASSFRVYDSLDNPIRIRQLALYPPNGPNGYPFGTDFNIDLARKQPAFGTTNTFGGWPLLAADGLVDPSSAWQTTLVGSNSLVINLQFTNKIGSAHLYSGMTGVAPISNFVLQYWTGSAWANIPGGSVTGNASGALVIPFTTPETTTKVQLLFTNSGTSAVQELCVFPANSNGGYPLGTGIVSNTPVTLKYDAYTDSYYYLSNSAAGQVVVESNGVPVLGAVGTLTWANRMAGWPGQYQVLLNYDTGTYRLINRATGLALSGAQMTTNVGAALADEPYAALPDQDWYLETLDGVNYYLVNQFSGLAADAQGGVLVQNVLTTNSPTQLWQINLAQIFPKKGIAGVGNVIGADRRVTFNANWSYSWWYGTSVAFPSGYQYFPMDFETAYRGNEVADNLWSLRTGWRSTGYSLNVLGYNEPDNTGQSDVNPTNGAIYWLNDQNLDLPLTGPAAANLAGTWLPIFFGYITNWGCRVDYLPGHEYVSPSSGSSSCWINPLQTAYGTWGIPMWMTEFGIVDWARNQSWTEEDNYNALAEFLWRAEQTAWLRKYSLFIFQADTNDLMAPNPWTATTPAPRSNAYDTNGNLTPFGELYAAWDDDANVETNKIYYIHNSGTRKRLQNTVGSTANATDIRVDDFSTKWTLQSAGSANLYYIVSTLDGRLLSYTSGGSVGLVASNTTGTAVQWTLTSYQYGWFYLDHPATGLRLQLAFNNSTSVATFTMVAQTTTSTAVQWRFIATLPPPAWTGNVDNTWSNPANWSSQEIPTTGQSVTFNSLSSTNLNTLLDTNFNVSSVIVSTPTGPVSIEGTNTLTVGSSGIDLSTASQNLTITAPMALNGSQSWDVADGQILNVNGGVSGSAALTVTGSGIVSLGGAATYNGGTTLNSGSTLQVSAANVLPNGTNLTSSGGDVTANGVLDMNGTAQAVNGLNGSGVVDNTSGAAATLTMGVNNDGGNFTGTIQDVGGNLALVKNGSATEYFRGTNTYVGGTIVNNGSITFYTASAFGTGPVTVNNGGTLLGAGNFAISNAVTLNSGTLRVGGGGSHTLTNLTLVVVTGNSLIQADGGTVNINLAGGLDMGDSGSSLTNSGSSTTTIISGPLTGGSGSIFVTLNETLLLSGSNSFAGTFRAQAGTLSIQNLNALQNATLDMDAADSGTVNLNNYSAVIGALTGSRSLALGSGAVSIGNNNTSTTYGGGLSGTSSLTKTGTGTLALLGVNTYTGPTTISSGTLALSGSGSLASTTITVAGGATFDVSSEASPFTLGGSTLANSSVGAQLAGANNCSVGALSLLYDGVTPAFLETNGTLTLSSGTVITINNTGAVLSGGHYTIIAAATTGSAGLVTGVLPTVTVTGNGAAGAASLAINGTGGLDLVVASTIAANSPNLNYTVSGGTLTLSWPGDHLGWIAQSNSVNLADTNSWFDINGSQSNTNLVIPTSSGNASVFYRLRYPN